MSDYTPTTDEVRACYSYRADWQSQEDVEAFDRWLAEHDAEVLREAGQRAYEWWMNPKPIAGMTDEDIACDLAAAARGEGEQA